MLILTRKPGESLYIGDDVKVTIVELKGHQIRVGIDAPKSYRIYREEIYLAILEENRKAAEVIAVDEMAGLENFSQMWEALPGAKSEPQPGEAKPVAVPTVMMPSAFGSLQSGRSSGGSHGPEVVFKRKRGK